MKIKSNLLSFRLGQSYQMLDQMRVKVEASHKSINDELAKHLMKMTIHEIEEIQALLGPELLKEIEEEEC